MAPVLTVHQKSRLDERLPRDLQAEEAVLAAILQSGARVLADLKSGHDLTSGAFFKEEHRTIFMRELLVVTQLRRATALRAANKLIAEGLLRRNGTGHRAAPHRFWVVRR